MMLAELGRTPQKLWEPFCGNDAIGKELERCGYEVHRTDLNDRGIGEARTDFLMVWKPPCKAIVSNPPFNLAHQIIEHAKFIKIEYMALLLKSDFFNSQRSHNVFKTWRPARIHALSWRPDFRNQGAPTMNCSWFVWDGTAYKTEYDILEKPKESP